MWFRTAWIRVVSVDAMRVFKRCTSGCVAAKNLLKCSPRVKRIDNCKLKCALVVLNTNQTLVQYAS